MKRVKTILICILFVAVAIFGATTYILSCEEKTPSDPDFGNDTELSAEVIDATNSDIGTIGEQPPSEDRNGSLWDRIFDSAEGP